MDLSEVLTWGGKAVRGVVDWVYTTGGTQGLLFFLAGVVTYHVYSSITQKFWKFLIILLVLAAIGFAVYGTLPQVSQGDVVNVVSNVTGNVSVGW